MMYIDGICLTRTFQSMLYVLLCNLFSFMGSTRRRQLNIYYRRFRCFFTFLLLLFFLLHSVLFVTSDFYLPLLLCTLAPAQALLLICFRSRCLFSCMSPNTILCISYFVQRNSLCIRHWSSNRITRKKKQKSEQPYSLKSFGAISQWQWQWQREWTCIRLQCQTSYLILFGPNYRMPLITRSNETLESIQSQTQKRLERLRREWRVTQWIYATVDLMRKTTIYFNN